MFMNPFESGSYVRGITGDSNSHLRLRQRASRRRCVDNETKEGPPTLSKLLLCPIPFALGIRLIRFPAAASCPNTSSVCFVNDLATEDRAQHFRGQDLLRGNLSDVAVQHNQVRPHSRN